MQIKNREISRHTKPFIVAEMSGNHNQSLERAIEIVDAAADSGVDAIKLQTLKPDEITLDIRSGDFLIKDKSSLWDGNSLVDLYKLAQTPWNWHAKIIERASKRGILCFSTAFDESAVDFLETLDVPAYKIASFENVNLQLIRKVAETGKPVIVSTGMASIGEIDDIVCTIREANCEQFVLLKCTSTYPASPKNSNVLTIPHMRTLFDCEIGLSDHTMGCGASIAAIACGATLIEKHFTLCRADGGIDADFSLEPGEMKNLVIEAERAWESLGKVTYGPTEAEQSSVQFRRSLYVAKDMAIGDVFDKKNLRIVRPGLGLSPKFYDVVLGRKVKYTVKKGSMLTWDLIA